MNKLLVLRDRLASLLQEQKVQALKHLLLQEAKRLGVDKPVHNPVDKYVEKPVERIVDKGIFTLRLLPKRGCYAIAKLRFVLKDIGELALRPSLFSSMVSAQRSVYLCHQTIESLLCSSVFISG